MDRAVQITRISKRSKDSKFLKLLKQIREVSVLQQQLEQLRVQKKNYSAEMIQLQQEIEDTIKAKTAENSQRQTNLDRFLEHQLDQQSHLQKCKSTDGLKHSQPVSPLILLSQHGSSQDLTPGLPKRNTIRKTSKNDQLDASANRAGAQLNKQR